MTATGEHLGGSCLRQSSTQMRLFLRFLIVLGFGISIPALIIGVLLITASFAHPQVTSYTLLELSTYLYNAAIFYAMFATALVMSMFVVVDRLGWRNTKRQLPEFKKS